MDILLLLILAVCVVTDLKSRKIYNKVIFPSLLLTLVLHSIFGGFSGLLDSLLGFAVGLGLLLIPYLMGGMGAGDVKLLALIGAIKGVGFVLTTSFYMALLGGVIALAILLLRKGFFQRVKGILYSVCSLTYGLKVPLGVVRSDYQKTYPYGVAIAGGAVVSLFFNGVLLQ
ncbi:prepilin peptidase [Bacillus sp. SCS-153A]|uniref:A24 family peptidase n=1 Tax=Rossellomorea sedimentorum TaxID=3115294 RepID=UPI003906361A